MNARSMRPRGAIKYQSHFGNSTVATGWGESTHAELSWKKSRGVALRWAIAGSVMGALIGVVAYAPAAWLARSVASATGQRLVLSDARGTVWSGSAIVVLTGGPGSRDASSLPGRLDWTLRPGGGGFNLNLRQDCCLNQTVTLNIRPAGGGVGATLLPSQGWVGQWPAAWLGGLGTPFNTLQLGGAVRLSSPGFTLEFVQGRVRFDGRADIELTSASSRLSTIEPLGSYRLTIASQPSSPGSASLNLSTQDGPLQLSGTGVWSTGGVRFRGEAQAGANEQAGLDNLLNIIGRRSGARSVISIG